MNWLKLTGVFPLLFSLACYNDQTSNDIETIISSWSVIRVEVSGENLVPEKKDHPKDDAYTLKMEVDSTFTLTTSVNSYTGDFQFSPQERSLSFQIKSGTRIGTIDQYAEKIDDRLLVLLSEVDSYDLSDSYLTLISERGSIELINSNDKIK
jgi:hypothetical protein